MNPLIKDLEGNIIEVTDLNKAIEQVAMYINFLYQHTTTEQADFAKKRQRYWKDIFQKLGNLKNENPFKKH